MANETRTPGKKGYKPRDPDRYVLTVEHYLREIGDGAGTAAA